ncbi:MAG: aminotransferase class I/II-fold pyridoxal phosphate-dependent enzyme [Trebonia sp.]
MMSVSTPLVTHSRADTRLHLSENPYGPSPQAVQAARDSLRSLHRYPDPSYGDLINGIAAHYNVDPNRVAVGNGADDLILMLALVARETQRPAVISENTFQSYPLSLQAAGVPVIQHPLVDYSIPVDLLIASFGAGASVAFVCNPHNPVGGILSADAVDRLCTAAREDDVIVVFDEAYAEYADGEGFHSALSAAAHNRNVCVMRTFSKAYGLAALRIGYVIGDPAVVARLNNMQMAFPFHVNRTGQAAALAALRDQKYLARICEKNRVARDLLYLGLRDLGIKYFPSHANFVLAHLPGSASHVAAELRTNAGMFVRDTANLGLTDHLRISIGRPDEMSALVSELTQLMSAAIPRLLQGLMMPVHDSFNGMVAAAAISAAFEMGLLDELRQSASVGVQKFAEVHDLDPLPLNGLCGVLEHARILHLRGDTITPGPEFTDAWLNKGYFLWLVRGYGDVLRRTAELCQVNAGPAARQIRDGGWIASAGKDYGEHFVDPVLSTVLSSVGFTNVADLGCGSAGRLIELARRHPGGRLVGVEVNAGAVEVARNAVQRAGFTDRIQIVNANIAKLEADQFPGIDLMLSFFLGHDLWPEEDCARTFRGLHAAFPDARTFLLSDTYMSPRHDGSDVPDAPIFTLGFEFTHALMRQYIPSLEEWRSFFAASAWQLAGVHDLAIPHSAIFQLSSAR